MKKRFAYIDVETTGLNHNNHGIVQIACIITTGDVLGEDRKIAEFNGIFNPLSIGCVIDDKALDINGHELKNIKKYPTNTLGLFIEFLIEHQRGEEPFIVIGQNVRFDLEFINAWFKSDRSVTWMGNLLSWIVVDTMVIARLANALGHIDPINYKLGTLCKEMDIKLKNQHDAMADIKATKKLLKKLLKVI